MPPLRVTINQRMETTNMTEPPASAPAPAPFNIDLNKILPTIAQLYKQFGWAMPIIEKYVGFKIPPEVKASLEMLAEGKSLSPDQMQQLQTGIETMQPQVGEPVLTKQLAEAAWLLHTKEGMGTREIAEQFTKDGSPCSHTTIARWVNMVDAEKHFGKIARAIQIGKFLGLAGIIALAFAIGHFLFH